MCVCGWYIEMHSWDFLHIKHRVQWYNRISEAFGNIWKAWIANYSNRWNDEGSIAFSSCLLLPSVRIWQILITVVLIFDEQYEKARPYVLLWECHSTKQQWKSTRWAFLISSFVCMFHIYHNNNFSSLKSGIQFTSSFYFLLRWQLQTILHTNTHRQYIHMWKSMQLPTLKYTEFIHTT